MRDFRCPECGESVGEHPIVDYWICPRHGRVNQPVEGSPPEHNSTVCTGPLDAHTDRVCRQYIGKLLDKSKLQNYVVPPHQPEDPDKPCRCYLAPPPSVRNLETAFQAVQSQFQTLHHPREEGGSSWDHRFLRMAQEVASWSKDSSTKVGCVLVNPVTRTVISTGFNGFPRGVKEEFDQYVEYPLTSSVMYEKRWERPIKYNFIEHAERNAVYNAARNGHATEGAWAYMNWDPYGLCPSCARALIQAGVKRVYGWARPFPGKDDSLRYDISALMCREAGVTLIPIEIEHE